MTISNWLPTLLNKAVNDSDKLALSPDLRWITEFALTDGFSESIRLNANYEVYERDAEQSVDRGFATVSILRGSATQWQNRPALEVRLTIDWFESAAGLISDREEIAYWYLSPEGLLLGFSWRGEAFAVQFEEPTPWQWVEDADLGNGKIYYEDSITIYGGILTGFITSFAKKFYKHRQKRWQIVAENKLDFGN